MQFIGHLTHLLENLTALSDGENNLPYRRRPEKENAI